MDARAPDVEAFIDVARRVASANTAEAETAASVSE
jgi:hypothetical protein